MEQALESLRLEQNEVASAVGDVRRDMHEVLRLLREVRSVTFTRGAGATKFCSANGIDVRHDARHHTSMHHTRFDKWGCCAQADDAGDRATIGSLAINRRGSLEQVKATDVTIKRTETLETPKAIKKSRGSLDTMQAHQLRLTDQIHVHQTRPTSRLQLQEQEQQELDAQQPLWPAHIQVREGFNTVSCTELIATGKEPHPATWANNVKTHDPLPDEPVIGDSCLERALESMMQDPNSGPFTILFDCCCILVACLDLAIVPYALAWDLDFHDVLPGSGLVACVFWSLTILRSFVYGYYQNGELELRPRRVAQHYFRTWLVPDILLVAADWFGVFLGSMKGLRSLRFLRSLDVLRTLKGYKHVDIFTDINGMDLPKKLFQLLFFATGLLFLNHWISCTWLLIGRVAPTENGLRWCEEARFDDMAYFDTHEVYQYVIAFHWSMAQLMLVGGEIDPYNSFERIFTVFIQVVGLIAGSTLVSFLSAKMVEWQMAMRDNKKGRRMLRQFLRENNVTRFAVRIQQQVAERQTQMHRLVEDDVPALKLLSNALLQELRYAMYRPTFGQHPLFRVWMRSDRKMVLRLCNEGLDVAMHRAQDHIFHAGSRAEHMYFLVTGTISYTQDSDFLNCEFITELVEKGYWLCEAALWVEWIHVGKAEAESDCQVLRVSAEGVVHALETHRFVREITVDYCRQFHKRLQNAQPPVADWPTDLRVPFTDFGDIVSSMEPSLQVRLSLQALDEWEAVNNPSWTWLAARRRGSMNYQGSSHDKLRAEIVNGKSNVSLNADGQLERLTYVVALRIERPDGCILAQLWKSEGDGDDVHLKPCCRLPGGKQEKGESPNEAIRRLLKTKFTPLVSHLEVQSTSRASNWEESKDFGVKTHYTRTEAHFKLRVDIPAVGLVLRMPEDKSEPQLTEPDDDIYYHTSGLELVGRQVPIMRDKAGKVFYAWLSPEEFHSLSSLEGEGELASSLAKLQSADRMVSI